MGVSTTHTMKRLSSGLLGVLLTSQSRNELCFTQAFSAVPNQSALAELNHGRLATALTSPSGKLTFCPELVLAEPQDPTAILLQTTAIQSLSKQMRACGAHAVLVQASPTALATFTREQEMARGAWPGPVPLIYCPRRPHDAAGEEPSLTAVAEAGASGVLVTMNDDGKSWSSVQELSHRAGSKASWIETCRQAREAGLPPIPEVCLDPSCSWTEDHVVSINELVATALGFTPVAVLLSLQATDAVPQKDAAVTLEPSPLPTIPHSLSPKVPILGSVRVPAGENRVGLETARFKASGFAGAVLRSDCMPGFQVMQLDLEAVSRFWSSCITDLKSTKSKSFGFRAKNNLDIPVATQWSNYKASVVESGALGDPNEALSSMVSSATGDYAGPA